MAPHRRPALRAPERGLSRKHIDAAPRLVSAGTRPRREHRIIAERTVIGSDPSCDFSLDEPTVSRRHALIRKRGGVYLVSDLGSTNGTLLNGRAILGEHGLRSGDQLRFGAAAFIFHAPARVPTRAARRGRLRLKIEGLILVFALGLAAGSTYLHRGLPGARPQSSGAGTAARLEPAARPQPASLAEAIATGAAPRAAAPVAVSMPAALPMPVSRGSTWLARLNYYRALARIEPVVEDPALSRATASHAHYLVVNERAAIRDGNVGPSFHTEDAAKPLYSAAGMRAAERSDVDTVFADPPREPEPGWAIEDWMSGPFHRLWLLNRRLRSVGYGSFCARGMCAAVLDVRSGIAPEREPGAALPAPGSAPGAVGFPAPGATVIHGAFTGDEAEWPDPLASCAGYRAPTGIPLTLMLGENAPAILDRFSLICRRKVIASCGFDASNYANPDPESVKRARATLSHFGAVVVVPARPLERGADCSAMLTVSGREYTWRFALAP